MEVFAYRDMANVFEWMPQIREIVESTPFRCRVLLYPQHRVGLLRIEYDGHSEQEVMECDLKLTAKMISLFESKGSGKQTIFPLEFVR